MTNQEFINKCKWRVSDYLNQLVQAILAIYAWIEFKECGL